jgi:dUTP pyrophosphatase
VIRLPVVLLDPDLPPPSYANEGDAGMDLRSRVDVVLGPGERALVPTGVAMALPAGHGGFVLPRSGLAARHGITMVNGPGLIDAGYRGEVQVPLLNTDAQAAYTIHRGDRIAQLVVLPVPMIALVEVDSLDGDDRGGGFGSSGR